MGLNWRAGGRGFAQGISQLAQMLMQQRMEQERRQEYEDFARDMQADRQGFEQSFYSARVRDQRSEQFRREAVADRERKRQEALDPMVPPGTLLNRTPSPQRMSVLWKAGQKQQQAVTDFDAQLAEEKRGYDIWERKKKWELDNEKPPRLFDQLRLIAHLPFERDGEFTPGPFLDSVPDDILDRARETGDIGIPFYGALAESLGTGRFDVSPLSAGPLALQDVMAKTAAEGARLKEIEDATKYLSQLRFGEKDGDDVFYDKKAKFLGMGGDQILDSRDVLGKLRAFAVDGSIPWKKIRGLLRGAPPEEADKIIAALMVLEGATPPVENELPTGGELPPEMQQRINQLFINSAGG